MRGAHNRKLGLQEIFVIECKKWKGRVWRPTVSASISRSWIVGQLSTMNTYREYRRAHLRIRIYRCIDATGNGKSACKS